MIAAFAPFSDQFTRKFNDMKNDLNAIHLVAIRIERFMADVLSHCADIIHRPPPASVWSTTAASKAASACCVGNLRSFNSGYRRLSTPKIPSSPFTIFPNQYYIINHMTDSTWLSFSLEKRRIHVLH